MLCIELELLTGRYVATAYNDRERVEWPPHPSRFLSALVSTWAEEDDPPIEEKQALEWLETQPPPTIHAAAASFRTTAPVFVPVNDIRVVSEPTSARAKLDTAEQALEEALASGDAKVESKARKVRDKALAKLVQTSKKLAETTKVTTAGIQSAERLLPEARLRQPRTFPVAIPEVPSFRYLWNQEPPAPVRSALAFMVSRIVRLGHSSSFVGVRISVGAEPEPMPGQDVWVPDESGDLVVRVPVPGQLLRLQEAFDLHEGVEPRILPTDFVRYAKLSDASRAEPPNSFFGSDWIVFERIGGDRLPGLRAVDVASALRASVMSHADEPIPAFLSGHDNGTEPTKEPHIAYVALPFVGSQYANGEILGVALVLPRNASAKDRRAADRAIAKWEAYEFEQAHGNESPGADVPDLFLRMGRSGAFAMQRVPFGVASRSNLRPNTWCHPSRFWMSATPIALDRNPGDLHDPNPAARRNAFDQAETSVVTACERIGLPRPSFVEITRSASLPGTTKPRYFPPFPRDPNKIRRVLVHAKVLFDEPVSGPVIRRPSMLVTFEIGWRKATDPKFVTVSRHCMAEWNLTPFPWRCSEGACPSKATGRDVQMCP